MSVATFKGEGNGGLARYRSKYRQNQPILKRNVLRSIRYLMMGSTISSLRTSSGSRSRDEVITASEDDNQNSRPVKRRRTSLFEEAASRSEMASGSKCTFDKFDQVMGERSRDSRALGKIQPVRPSDFYGKSHPHSENPEISRQVYAHSATFRPSIKECILPPTITDFEQAIRLDIKGIILKPPKEDESVAFIRGRRQLDEMDINCICSVALFSAKNDDNPGFPIVQDDYEEVFQKKSSCVLRTKVDGEGKAIREFIDLEPFVLPKAEFYTNRKKRDRQGQFVHSWGLAEDYYVSIKLEPAGLQKQWPPFDLISLAETGTNASSSVTDLLKAGELHKNDLELLATMRNLFNPALQGKSAPLKLSHRLKRQKIPYSLKFKISWSCPSHLSKFTAKIKIEPETANSKIAALPVVAEKVPASPPSHTEKEIATPDSPADSRGKRQRSNVTTYNLKDLMAVQQGKSPRVRKTKDIQSRSAHENSRDSNAVAVTYTIGKADAAELLIKQQTVVTGWDCPICGQGQGCFDNLRIHLHMNHTDLKFSLRRSNPQRIGFFVEISKRGLRGSPTSLAQPRRIFQLSQPRTLFNLDKFLDGDENWTKVRTGPQHNMWPDHLHDQSLESSSSSSLHGSRHSSPNTSNDTDDLMDFDNDHSKLAIRPHKKYFVPKTSKPLYDTITKQILVPGTEIPGSDDEKDEQWLNQKHRDIILDYDDITDDEKDYITKWNPFIMKQRLTSERHLGDAILRFVEQYKFWFAQRQSRKKELAKTMETFLMRGVVNTKCLSECILILKDAEKLEGSKENEVTELERAVSPVKRRGGLDCDCGGHTQAADRVVCHGRKCLARFYHRKCAEKSGRPVTGRWLCDHCVS